MNRYLTVGLVAIAMSAFGTAYAGGAGGGCAFGKSYYETSVDEEKYSDIEKKLAKLNVPLSQEQATSEAVAGDTESTKADASSAQREKTAQ